MQRIESTNSKYFPSRRFSFLIPSANPKSLFNEDWFKKSLKNKHVISISLTGMEKEDKRRFCFIRQEAKRLEYASDTLTVLKVHFTEESTYGQFFKIIDMLHEDMHSRYTFVDDDLYILGSSPKCRNQTNSHK